MYLYKRFDRIKILNNFTFLSFYYAQSIGTVHLSRKIIRWH